MDTFEASYPCGSVKLEISGAPVGQVYCHCDDCQHAHGAAYVPRSIHNRDDIKILAGETTSWTNRIRRMVICSACGSHLFGEQDGSPFRGVNAANFPDDRFTPTIHLHCRYALAPLKDELPHFYDLPSEFGGSGKRMDWL